MLGLMLPKLLGTVVEIAASVAVDSAVKVATPSNVKAVTGFIIKGGSMLLGGLVAAKLGSIVVSNTEAIVEAVQRDPETIVVEETVTEK